MNSKVSLFHCDLDTHNNSVYYNLLKANLGTAVPYRSWHTVIMCSFKCLYHQLVFQKKQLLHLKWLLPSFMWYLTEDLNLLRLFDRNVGLTTKIPWWKFQKNVVEEEPSSQTRVNMTNTKNKALVECANKNSTRLICLTNQLEILHRAASKVFNWWLFSTPIPLLLIDTQLPLEKITLKFFEYQFFELWILSTFMLWTCSAPPPRIT